MSGQGKAAALRVAFESPELPCRVSYPGTFGPIVRDFPTQARAIQWARQVGQYDRARFVRVSAA